MASPTPIASRSTPTLASRLDKQVKQLAGRVAELESTMVALCEDREKLVAELGNCYDNLTELNLRCLFVMMLVQVNRDVPTGLVDSQGRTIVETRTETLYDRYGEQRHAFKQEIAQHEQAIRQGASLEGQGQSSANVNGDEPAKGHEWEAPGWAPVDEA